MDKASNVLPHNTIAFTLYRNKSILGYNWIRLLESKLPDNEKIQSRIDLDLSPFGMPHERAKITRQVELTIQDKGIPIRYYSTGVGGDINIETHDLQKASVFIGGKNVECDIRNCCFILESNFVAMEWLFLMMHIHYTSKINTWFFDVNSLQRLPYEAKMLEETKWITNLGCEIGLDHSRKIQQFSYKSQDLRINLENIFEPKWGDKIIYDSPVFKYQIPSDAKFKCIDVTINSNDIDLGGIYRIPDSNSHDPYPLPALLFISGSGRQDKHGFTDDIDLSTYAILDYIGNNGFVVLSVDDRELINSKKKKIVDVGLSDIINDYKCALEALLSFVPFVDKTKVFLLGHSEGALVAMKLAKLYNLAGLILMAPPGRTVDQILLEQAGNNLLNSKFTDGQILTRLTELGKLLEFAKENKQLDEKAPMAVLTHSRSLKWLSEHIRTPPDVLARDVKCPVMIMFGDKDFQLSPEKDGLTLLNKLRDSGNQNVTFSLLHNVDHLFKVEEKKSTPSRYYDNTRPISREFLQRVVRWLNLVASKMDF